MPASVRRGPAGRLLAGLVIICLAGCPAALAGGTPVLRLEPVAPEFVDDGRWRWRAPWPRTILTDVEFGTDPVGGVLVIDGVPGRYRVQAQFETSLAVGDEGPHLDLVGWRSCVSAWRPATQVAAGRFRLPVPTAREEDCVPRATSAELRAAIRETAIAVGLDTPGRWVDLVPPGTRPGEAPTYTAISAVRVRVEQFRGGRWQPVTTLVFRMPMGC